MICGLSYKVLFGKFREQMRITAKTSKKLPIRVGRNNLMYDFKELWKILSLFPASKCESSEFAFKFANSDETFCVFEKARRQNFAAPFYCVVILR